MCTAKKVAATSPSTASSHNKAAADLLPQPRDGAAMLSLLGPEFSVTQSSPQGCLTQEAGGVCKAEVQQQRQSSTLA